MAVGEVVPNVDAPRAAARLEAPAARRVFTIETMLDLCRRSGTLSSRTRASSTGAERDLSA
jgi:hypothetical protein